LVSVPPHFRFRDRVPAYLDPSFLERNNRMGEGIERKGEGRLEWGGWLELTGENEESSPKLVPLFCDLGEASLAVGHILI
jgi:hypothetical protein